METLGDKIASKNEQHIFNCIECDYKCCKKYNFNRHLMSSRHIELTKGDKIASKIEQNEQKNINYCCEKCNKKYSSRNGLWRHKKVCNYEETHKNVNEDNDKELIMMLIKQNSEMLEIMKNGTYNNSNNTTNTNTNSHNKSFNLNFFLNETCKDAMNIMDFVDSIKIQLSDLERVGELGYVEGISNIIIKNLKELDITKRPVHCTDKKRETMYIKDQDKWEKDEEQKTMHKVVRKVACKNQNSLQLFKDAHPDCNKYHSKFSDKYNKIIVESMGGTGDDDWEKEEKIIKKISKEVGVDKENE